MEEQRKIFKIYVGRDPREGVEGRYTIQGNPNTSKYFGDRSLGSSKEEYERFIGPDSKDAGRDLGEELVDLGFDSFQIINGKLWFGELKRRSWGRGGPRYHYLQDCKNECSYHDNKPFTLTDVEPLEDHEVWRIVDGINECGRRVSSNAGNYDNLKGVYYVVKEN